MNSSRGFPNPLLFIKLQKEHPNRVFLLKYHVFSSLYTICALSAKVVFDLRIICIKADKC